MPTGYTAIIEDGNPTFKEYALGCARAFGALIHMRDDDLSVEIRPRVADTTYEEKRLKEVTADLAALEKMTPEALEVYVADLNRKAIKEWEQRALEKADIQAKYDKMKAQVLAWEPPTPEHQNLKKFMLEQIQISLPYPTSSRPKPISAREYRTSQTAYMMERIADLVKSIQATKDRAEQSNKWVKDLVESL